MTVSNKLKFTATNNGKWTDHSLYLENVLFIALRFSGRLISTW